MAAVLVEVNTYTPDVTVPEAGDLRTAASVVVPFQALANRTKNLDSRIVGFITGNGAGATYTPTGGAIIIAGTGLRVDGEFRAGGDDVRIGLTSAGVANEDTDCRIYGANFQVHSDQTSFLNPVAFHATISAEDANFDDVDLDTLDAAGTANFNGITNLKGTNSLTGTTTIGTDSDTKTTHLRNATVKVYRRLTTGSRTDIGEGDSDDLYIRAKLETAARCNAGGRWLSRAAVAPDANGPLDPAVATVWLVDDLTGTRNYTIPDAGEDDDEIEVFANAGGANAVWTVTADGSVVGGTISSIVNGGYMRFKRVAGEWRLVLITGN
jgi:hypothetical protein